MSVDWSISLLNWERFIAKNASSVDTEQLLFDNQDELTEESTCGSIGGDSMEATDIYNGIRSELSAKDLEILDRCFAACFWDPVQEDLENLDSPPISPRAEFGLIDVNMNGPKVYVQSLMSPSSVKSLAEAWRGLPMERLESVLKSTYADDDWQDGFASPDEWMAFIRSWQAIFEEAAQKGRGLSIRVG